MIQGDKNWHPGFFVWPVEIVHALMILARGVLSYFAISPVGDLVPGTG